MTDITPNTYKKSNSFLNKYFFIEYGTQVLSAECIGEGENGFVFKFRWGTIFRHPHFVDKSCVICEDVSRNNKKGTNATLASK